MWRSSPMAAMFQLRNSISSKMAHFDEKSGLVLCRTPWGTWGQTVDDVQIEVNVAKGTKSRDVKCTIRPKEIVLSVHGETVFKARRYATESNMH